MKSPPDYGTGPAAATPALGAILRARIARDGPLRFPDFMAAALYHPELGYYAREPRQVGRGGDFFTSVSVGPLFGELLARRFLRDWQESGRPARWRIVECGAHDGSLAADILQAISRLAPAALVGLDYVIPEPLPALRAAQRATLAAFPQATFPAEASALEPLPGIAFGNEVLDALPFHIIERRIGGWQEFRIAADRASFREVAHEIDDPALTAALEKLGNAFPDGYRSEIRTNFQDFLTPLTRCLSSGLLLWCDYGFARPEYYHPGRSRGTLRTFSNHRAAEDPLATPGEIDITAHVDFTAVAEAGMALGCQPLRFQNQGAWLTEAARDWLISLEGNPDPAALRQFQTLTHPAHLGGSFHVLEMAWNRPAPPLAAGDSHRLALQACRGSAPR